MNCDAVRNGLETAFDEGCPPAKELLGHIESCRSCASYFEALEAIDSGLSAGETASPLLVPRILQELERTKAPARVRRFPALAGLCAAAILLACAGRWLVLPLREAMRYSQTYVQTVWRADWRIDSAVLMDWKAWLELFQESYRGALQITRWDSFAGWDGGKLSLWTTMLLAVLAGLALCTFNGWAALSETAKRRLH